MTGTLIEMDGILSRVELGYRLFLTRAHAPHWKRRELRQRVDFRVATGNGD